MRSEVTSRRPRPIAWTRRNARGRPGRPEPGARHPPRPSTHRRLGDWSKTMRSLDLFTASSTTPPTALALAATLALAACGGGDGGSGDVTGPCWAAVRTIRHRARRRQGRRPGRRALRAGQRDNLADVRDESGETISRQVPITGVPISRRMIAIDFRASNGKLDGVGNDSRVDTIDNLTGPPTRSARSFSPATISPSTSLRHWTSIRRPTACGSIGLEPAGGTGSSIPTTETATTGNTPALRRRRPP